MEPLLIGSSTVAQVAFLSLELDRYRYPDGTEFERVAVRHPGAVGVVPVLGDRIVLVRQFRAPLGATLLEIPAGKLDVEGEDPAAAAARECEEEVGYRPGRLTHVRTVHTTPGFSDERIEIYLASDLVEVGVRPDGPEEHRAEVVEVTFAEVQALIASGGISDAKTLIGLQDAMRMMPNVHRDDAWRSRTQ